MRHKTSTIFWWPSAIGALIGSAAIVITVYHTHPHTTRDGSLLVASAVAVAPALINVAWALLSPPRWEAQTLSAVRRLTKAYAIAAAIGFALGVGSFVLRSLEDFGWLSSLLFAGLVFGVPGALLAALISALTPKAGSPREVRAHRVAWIVAPLASITALMAWSFSHVAAVHEQARAISRGRPYCIGIFEVGDRRTPDYFRRATMYDLTALQMRMDEVNTGGVGTHLLGPTALLQVNAPGGAQFWSWRESSDARNLKPMFRLEAPRNPRAEYFEPRFEIEGC